MPQRPFIFRGGSTELVLPVTPKSYRVDTGVNIEVINIHELGDVVLTGYGTLSTIKISCMLPANDYHFARDNDPRPYIEQFETWVADRKHIRFIVGNTGVNIKVIVENFAYGEDDGTGDVYADIILREYRDLKVQQFVTSPAVNKPRASEDQDVEPVMQSYSIREGDTLSAICRKYYGDGSEATCNKLAQYNGISNPYLIFTGTALKIPQPLP